MSYARARDLPRSGLVQGLLCHLLDADCESIDRLGTDSHALCYVETGFCDLAPADWLAIIHTIDVGDAPFRVMLATAQGCLGEWLGPVDR